MQKYSIVPFLWIRPEPNGYGEIAYMMASRLEKNYGIKLVIFDTVFRNSYFDLLTIKIRALLNLKPEARWYHRYAKVNAELLYFYAALDKKIKRYKIEKGTKFSKMRQLKYDSEYLVKLSSVSFGLPNGLKYFKNVSKFIALKAYHHGDNGILNRENFPRIKDEIDIFLERTI